MAKTLGLKVALAVSLMLAGSGVLQARSNDTGGIIPWSPEAELTALDVAQSNCGAFNKYALITSVHRVYGDYIAYACSWRPLPAIYRNYR